MVKHILKFAAFVLSSLLILLIVYLISREKETEPFSDSHSVIAEETFVKEETAEKEIIIFYPVAADPAAVINWQRGLWRNPEYEVFSWDKFAGTTPILIFDFADYAVQDRMLKRLAFFTEKAGFRGRLAQDSEIENLHGWNAHDYRAQDLAAFFDLAQKTDFPLLDEERELEKILLSQQIICRKSGGIFPGDGAVISISRESADYLRLRFLAHEGFHALYFIDEEFRSFCRLRWENFPSSAKRFITAYFDYQQYDTTNEYLLINEFMGHILQQPVAQAADYFGRTLPSRLEDTRRASYLPLKDNDAGNWPELASAFTEEAQALSQYVSGRWDFAAGRVWSAR